MRGVSLFLLALLLLPGYATAAGTVNINSATLTELETLPGIGPSKAAAIINYRIESGGFKTIEDIQKVKGIGAVTFANMKELLTVRGEGTREEQPPAPPESSKKGEVTSDADSSPVISSPNTETHEEAVMAPTAANTLAAVGAASPHANPFASVWTLGLLAVLLIASTAFIFL